MTNKGYWTPAPPTSYAIEINGDLYGIGVNPVFAAVPGAWNILYLLAMETIDSLYPWTGEIKDYPIALRALAWAAATALQQDKEMPARTLGNFAVSESPLTFIARLRKRDDLFIVAAKSPLILEVMEDNAKKIVFDPPNVTRIEFRRRVTMAG